MEDVQMLKRGDYSLHVLLEEGRALLGDSEDATTDPMVSFSAFGKTKTSKPVEDVGGASSLYWGEHFFFSISQADSDAMMRSTLNIEVKDHNNFSRDALIGAFSLDLSYLYSQESHAIMHKWFILSNPNDEDFEKVRGYIKIGASLLHESDTPIDLTTKDNIGKEDDVMMPPEIKPEAKQVIIDLLKAESLPVLDRISKSLDAYCTAQISNNQIKSKVIVADQETLSAYWYEALYIPFIEPGLSHFLSLTFSDRDAMSPKDDLVGSMQFSLSEIQRGRYKDYFWSNLYGAQNDPSDEEAAELMNCVSRLGSHWRGRILMRITCVSDHNALQKTESINTPEIRDVVENTYEATTGYMLRVHLYNATALPKKSGEYSIKVCFCEAHVQSAELKASNRRIDWYKKLSPRVAGIPFGAENNIPDVIVYLMEDDSPICFKRIPARECFDHMAGPTWIQLEPDKSVGKVKNTWEAGVVGIRIHVCDEDSVPKGGDWNSDPPKPPEKEFTLLCNLYQGRNLPAADKSGLADPFVTFYIDGYETSTEKEPLEGTLNPTWYKPLPLRISLPVNGVLPPIWVFVWDWDRVGDNDLIGMTCVPMTEAQINLDAATLPKWFPLNMGTPGTEMGEILLSFNLYDGPNIPRYPLEPEFEDVDIEINVLGLRDLHPAIGSLPVNKAFVKFDLKGLRLTGGSLIKNTLQTQPREPGRSPNINTVLSFSCLLPKDPMFCPALTCTVHDQLFSGLSQPHIGTFAMDLGKFKTQTKETLNSVISLAKNDPLRIQSIAKSRMEELKTDSFLRLDSKRSSDADEMKHLVPAPDPKKTYPEESKLSEEKELILPDSNRELTFSELIAGYAFRPAQFSKARGETKLTEQNIPDVTFYKQIGYNREPGDSMKHYRYFIGGELEESDYLGESPFHEFELKKGQSRGLSVFDRSDKLDAAGQKSNEKVTGKFKGLVKITPKTHKSDLKRLKSTTTSDIDNPDLLSNYAEKAGEFDEIKKKLLCKTQCLIRVYLIDAYDLEQKDRESHSDPYVVLKLGKQKKSNKDNYQEDTSNPKFYTLYEFDATLPGESMLKVQVWDHDDFLSDEKIGTTKIDLEDRFFSKRFMSFPQQPIETRKLMHNSSRRPQGYIRLWTEIIPSTSSPPPPLNIMERPPAVFEARLIVWKSEDVENMDFEGVSDLYVRAFINRGEAKETDTHFRCQSGKGSWNWRMKFLLSLPQESARVTVQIWDRDYLSRNDFIAECSFDFTDLAAEAWETNRRVKRRDEKFWMTCMKRNEDGGFESGGKVMLSFELVPEDRAKACTVGEGRDNPNVDPYLPPPVGRFEWSLNPLKMISQFCGPEFKFKICLAVCCVLCVLIMCFVFPMFFSDGVAILIFGG